MRPYVWFLVLSVVGVLVVGARPKMSSVLGPRSSDPVVNRGPRNENRGGLIIPVDGVTADHLKSDFNDSRGGFRVHQAIDILAPRGTPVRAAVAGTIRKLFVSRAGGITIYEFDENQDRVYYYAHLDRYADFLVEGMTVAQGDVIGYVGTTGNAPANTPHLHFAISILPPAKEWWKGEPIDPYPLLTEGATTGTASTLR
ncbi:MAG TPA: M23 family metallopeptidase [Thermoanaerobaculia bacterium]|nr:M23 family metallopeptidase [Thermoanaerobaculia bacterium]